MFPYSLVQFDLCCTLAIAFTQMRIFLLVIFYLCIYFFILLLLLFFLQVSPGDTGWDVFSLDYHVDGPISTVRV